MSGIYSFRSGPTYRGATREEVFDAAMSQPMSMASTFFDQAKGGVLESFGLGTFLRGGAMGEDAPSTPGLVITPEGGGESVLLGDNPTARRRATIAGAHVRQEAPQELERRRADAGVMSEETYKSSAYFRDDIPWDAGMTEDRAASLALMNDAKKVREFYASKRPITSFIGNLAGQAVDPINYIPVAGPLVKAAAVARVGKIGGAAIHGAVDAAGNTALFGLATQDRRAAYGDDVSWQATVSQIATAALIGGAFGSIGGVLEGRHDAKFRAQTEARLSTLKTTQEARIALNEGIDALVRGEDVNLSPNALEPLARIQQEIIAYHGSPHSFDRFDVSKIGTGEGNQSFGRGLYFTETEAVARKYREDLALPTTPENDVAKAYLRQAGGDTEKAVALVEAFGKETGQDLSAVAATLRDKSGALYEVSLKANKDELLDWDTPMDQQPEAVRLAVAKAMNMPLPKDGRAPTFENEIDGSPTGEQIYRLIGDQAYLSPGKVSERLRDAGLPGIKYLDGGSRDAGDGTRNFVIFDDGRVAIRSRNGQPIDNTTARHDPIPEGRAQAETRIAKPDDYKAMAAQYGVEPEKGTFPEEADIQQLAVEGRLTDADAATMDAAQGTYDDGAAYGEAIKSLVGCLL